MALFVSLCVVSQQDEERVISLNKRLTDDDVQQAFGGENVPLCPKILEQAPDLLVAIIARASS
jgi:hypothetical protein